MVKFLLLTVACAMLGGCAIQTLQLGATQEEVLARYGKPSAVVALPSGTRLQYSLQPSGQSAVMVDLDAAGKVASVRQVLNPADFARIAVGQWTRADALREFGPPASIDHVYAWTGDILTYRWLDVGQSMYFYIYLDPNNVVQRTGQGMQFYRDDVWSLWRR